jgi:hypothetical protein
LFVVRDHADQQFVYVYIDTLVAAKPLTKDKTRRIATRVAKLPNYCRKP